MKKTVLLACMLAACTSGMAQGVDGNAAKITINEGLSFLPSTFTTDGKTYISIHSGNFYKPDAETLDITLYDEEFTPVHSFKLPQVENGMEYRIIDQRGWIHIIYPDDTELWSCTGEWSKTREDLNWDTPAIPMSFIDSDDADLYTSNYFYITQTLFNDDEEYEYLQPIYEYSQSKEERDQDGDVAIDYIETWYTPQLVGFKIMTVTGTELQRIDFDTHDGLDYYNESLEIIKINGKYYLCVDAYSKTTQDDDYSQYLFFYRINRETSSVQKVGAPIKGMSVRPRMQDRGGSFTVELDGDSNVERNVVVVNSAGQTVWEKKVPAGQKTVNISASRLSQGLNVVTVRGGKQPESCKVIVK